MKTPTKNAGIAGEVAALAVWEGQQMTRRLFVRRVGLLVSECESVVTRVGSLGSVDYESRPKTTTFVPSE